MMDTKQDEIAALRELVQRQERTIREQHAEITRLRLALAKHDRHAEAADEFGATLDRIARAGSVR